MKKNPLSLPSLFNFLSKIIIYSIVFSYSCPYIQAQDGYVSGFIVSTKNDTLRGLIKEELKPMGFILQYKKSEYSQVEEYIISTINEYYYTESDELFERNFTMKGKDQREVFFKCHVRGAINFYTYIDDHLSPHFYIKGEDGLSRELKVEKKKNGVRSNKKE